VDGVETKAKGISPWSILEAKDMSPELQQFIALSLVALAALSIFWRLAAPWFRAEKSSGCSTGCGQCPANQNREQTPTGLPLVQLQLPKSRSNI
jgi:hypothetical protein